MEKPYEFQRRPKGLKKRIIFDMTHLTSLLQDIGAINLTDEEVDKYYQIKYHQKTQSYGSGGGGN